MEKTISNPDVFLPKKSLSKRGFNSSGDKRKIRQEKHPASGLRKKHGRERGR